MSVKEEGKCKEICGYCSSDITELKDLCYVDKKICCGSCCPKEKFNILNTIKYRRKKHEEKF